MIRKIGKPNLWVLAALALLAVPSGYIGTSVANGSAATRALITDPMLVFSARSPGARGAAALTQTKTAYVRTGPATDDFLGTGPGFGLPDDVDVTVPEAPAALDQGFALPQKVAYSEFSIPVGLYRHGESGPFSGAIGGGGGSGPGTPGGGGVIPPFTPPRPPTAVPEPEMWLMMITGFFAIGSAMRSRKRHAVKARS